MIKQLPIDTKAYEATGITENPFSKLKSIIAQHILVGTIEGKISMELGDYLMEIETVEEFQETIVALLEEKYDIFLDWLYSLTTATILVVKITPEDLWDGDSSYNE